MTGAEIDRRIRAWLGSHQVLGIHHRDSIGATVSGWPDWEFVGPGGILYREVKGSNDVLSLDQRRVGAVLQAYGVDWAVWGPRDVIPGGRAFRQLEEIA
ncbi:MAG TPA: hypothetical protein VGG75_05600 [Trebonia sp.]|jgi:hypothetical protein